MTIVLASIPSPSSGDIGPIHVYGLLLAVGVLVAAKVADVRWRRGGHQPPDAITDIAFWVVVSGVVGARVYHVITDYQLYTDDWLGVFRIWSGGLSIWGAVAGGAIAVVVLARVRRLDTLALMDAMAPGIALAQAIGRWGNWFNQELFGRPTDLPWGLEIDPARRPAGYEQTETFHPTFLYESLWCLAIAGTLIWAEKRFRFARGQTFALYVALYTFGRFWFENLRIDTAHEVLGLRVNAWVSIGLFVASLAWFAWLGRRRRDLATEPGQPGPSGEAEEVGAGASPAGPADSAESEAIRPGSDGVAD